MARSQPRRPSVGLSPVLQRHRYNRTASSPRTLPSGIVLSSPRSARSGTNADSPYGRSGYSPASFAPDSPNSKIRYNDLANIQLAHELNATLPISPGPITPRGPVRIRKAGASSVPTTQESHPQLRTIRSGSMGHDIVRDPRPIPRPIRFPPSGKVATPAVHHAQHAHRHVRQSSLGNPTVPDAKISYPGPFRQLPEDASQADPDTRPGFQFRHESLVRQPDDKATSQGLGISSSAVGKVRASRSPPQSRSKNPPVEAAPSHDFPDGGLDLDMNEGPVASDIAGERHNEPLESHARSQRLVEALDQNIEDILAQRADHAVQLELAQIEIDLARERQQEAEDRLLLFQEQLDDADARTPAAKYEHTMALIETRDMHLAQIASLIEQLIEANERVAETGRLLAQRNDKLEALTARRINGFHSHGEVTAEADDFVKGLLDNEKKLREQIATLQAQYDDERLKSDEPRKDDHLYVEKRNASLKVKADRHDALWDTLRNFQDMETEAGQQNTLQAKITYLEAVVRNAKAQINGTGEVEDVEEDGNHQQEIVRLNGEVKDLNFQLQDALDRVVSTQGMERLWKEGAPTLRARRGCSVKDQEETAQDKTYFETLTDEINALNSEVNALRMDNEQLGRTVRGMNEGPVPADSMSTEQLEEDLAATDAHVNRLNEEVALAYNKVWASQKTSKKLQLELAKASETRDVQDERVVEVQKIHSMLKQVILDMGTEQEECETMIASLRRDLQDAREELAGLRNEYAVNRSLHDSGAVDMSTHLELNELPRAKRVRRSPSKVDDEFHCDIDPTDDDELLSPSSFPESIPSPHAPRLGRTREQSRSLSRSHSPKAKAEAESDRDEEEARFQRDLTAAASGDPREGVIVIRRSKTTRALRSAKSKVCKRKRCS